ncbi:MAG: 3-isopropylmalate dehydratase [Candidatus Krumholzibacteria bacterium]|jgi:3-isopropylmalate/(R)-2-methylmalate dehydratase small subunit|nr:3-isopropylmalate dehydratase [Candidatus Krumholzibacteria bacterium]
MAKVVFKVGDDVSTDTIYPGRFMATVLPSETPQFAFADFKEFNARVKAGDLPAGAVIVGGKNFGCGSSREQAASCLASLTVVARDFARIFLQNAINVGLRTVICPTIEANEGDELELTPTEVRNKTKGDAHPIVPLPPARQAIVDAGGLIPYARELLLQERAR